MHQTSDMMRVTRKLFSSQIISEVRSIIKRFTTTITISTLYKKVSNTFSHWILPTPLGDSHKQSQYTYPDYILLPMRFREGKCFAQDFTATQQQNGVAELQYSFLLPLEDMPHTDLVPCMAVPLPLDFKIIFLYCAMK